MGSWKLNIAEKSAKTKRKASIGFNNREPTDGLSRAIWVGCRNRTYHVLNSE